MKIIKKVFDFGGAPVLLSLFAILFYKETRQQLRKREQLRSQRIITNSLVAIPAFGLLRLLFLPIVVRLAYKNLQWKFGLRSWFKGVPVIGGVVSFLMMDYTNYLWHVLNHKWPFLWRFHLVHHTDRDLDVTTAIRFHFGEILGSVIYRGAFILLSGATPLNVLIYEIVFEGATQFHHSNWNIPVPIESRLNKLLVTPRMHGIHHSEIKDETDSNYSVIFSFWDRLHKTLNLNVLQHQLTIGVPSYRNTDELTAANLLQLPFAEPRQWNANLLHRDRSAN